MSLPSPWVDEIFRKLLLVYGTPFIDRWRDMDLAAVKQDWGQKLSALQNAPKAIAYALEHVDPGKPPTVLEFRALAHRAPAPEVLRLDPPKADPARIAEVFKRLAPICKPGNAPGRDGKQWARAIIARAESGHPVRPVALKQARQALQTPAERAGVAFGQGAQPNPTDAA